VAILQEYRGRKILKYLSGRIMPQKNSAIPDCICFILLTADTLYVLEDNYDGTFTTHFEIPCGHIERIEEYKDKEADPLGGTNRIAQALALALGGILALSSEKPVNHRGFTIYLYGKKKDHQQIYFSETGGNIKGFIKAFNKLKSHKM